jgi:hypothetical protein
MRNDTGMESEEDKWLACRITSGGNDLAFGIPHSGQYLGEADEYSYWDLSPWRVGMIADMGIPLLAKGAVGWEANLPGERKHTGRPKV